MKIEIPDAIVDQVVELCDLVRENPRTIRTEDAARFIGMNPATYRAAATRGQLKYAVGVKRSADGNACIRTQTLPFFLAMMNMNGLDLMKGMNA